MALLKDSFTRVTSKIGRFTNTNPVMKRMQQLYLRRIQQVWMRQAISHRVFMDNAKHLMGFKPDRGVILASNHRSFFDMYINMLSLYELEISWGSRQFFPVRKDFFYDNPLGMAVNFTVGMGVMYPPITRKKGRPKENQYAVDFMIEQLADPRTVVGIHPEGRRGKGDNPYELLRAQPGVGRLAVHSKAYVIPYFILGPSNNLLKDVHLSHTRHARKQPIIISYGDPVDCSRFYKSTPRASLYKQCSDLIHAEIRKLGQREKMLREQIVSGEIGDDHPDWLSNLRPRTLDTNKIIEIIPEKKTKRG